MSKESEKYRLQVLGRLKYKYGKADPPEVLEAKKVIARHREEEAKAGPMITRASLPLEAPDQCPACWINFGHHNNLVAVPADEPDLYDRWKCRACGYTEDREA